MKPVALIRRFAPVTASRDEDVDLDHLWWRSTSTRSDWTHLRRESRVVILADAGAGKTFELRAEAQRMLASGHAAFFVRLEDVSSDFGAAFEVGDPARFEAWLGGADEAWFFLDSVDEARLETPRAFETAMRAFAARVHDAQARAHVILSSRPYAWRSKLDGDLIDELLPYVAPRLEPEEGAATAKSPGRGPEPDAALKLYRLSPLDRDEIALFAAQRGVSDGEAFLAALERAALCDLAQLPFDLEQLIAVWKDLKMLDGRLAVLEHGVRLRLTGGEGATRRLPLDRAQTGARRLALASTLAEEPGIRLPGGQGPGLNAAALLAGWSSDEISELLSRGVFSDPLFGMVRFRHREIRELLAAQALAEALARPQVRDDAKAMLFREIYGQAVVVPRLRPLLPWLILFDAAVRERTLSLRPEIAIEGGDPAQLPLAVRIALLRDIVAGIVSKANRGGDNAQIARIAQPDLEEAVLEILAAHFDDDDVVFFIGRLIWQGGMPTAAARLRPIASDPERGDFARVVAVRAVLSLAEVSEREALWTDLQARDAPLPRRVAAELAADAPAEVASVDRVLDLIGRLEPFKRHTSTGFSQALHSFTDRLPMMSDRAADPPLPRLVDGFSDYLFREPHVQGRRCGVSQAYAWLMAPAMRAVERLIIGRSTAALGVRALEILHQAPELRSYGDFEDREYRTKLADLVPRWEALNDALFWHAVDRARRDSADPLIDDWPVEVRNRFWRFDEASFPRTLEWVRSRPALEDRSLALSRCFRTYANNGRPARWRRALWRAVKGEPRLEAKLRELMRPAPNPQRTRWKADERRWAQRQRAREAQETEQRAVFVARVQADPEQVRNPRGVAPGQLTWDQVNLLRSIEGDGMRLSRGAGSAWTALIPEFGESVALAFRDAALRHWRAYDPGLLSEGADGASIPYHLVFAMAGLEIEAGANSLGLASLSQAEARHAMRYALWELNGFPSWFEPLFKSCPEIGFDLISRELAWDLANNSPEQPTHYILHDLVYHAPWLQSGVAERIRAWLWEHGAANIDVLRHARAIMVGGGVAPTAIASLARRRAEAAETPQGQLPAWLALWVDAEPDTGVPALEAALSSLEFEVARDLAQTFLANFMGDRHGGGAVVGAWRTPDHLRRLYMLMHRYVRVAEDIDRSDGGVFSPTSRDDAQDARNRLFGLLADTPGEATYRAIEELARDHPEVGYRAYMHRAARERATADGDLTWTEPVARELVMRLFDAPKPEDSGRPVRDREP